jgi:hypothetical protein
MVLLHRQEAWSIYNRHPSKAANCLVAYRWNSLDILGLHLYHCPWLGKRTLGELWNNLKHLIKQPAGEHVRPRRTHAIHRGASRPGRPVRSPAGQRHHRRLKSSPLPCTGLLLFPAACVTRSSSSSVGVAFLAAHFDYSLIGLWFT